MHRTAPRTWLPGRSYTLEHGNQCSWAHEERDSGELSRTSLSLPVCVDCNLAPAYRAYFFSTIYVFVYLLTHLCPRWATILPPSCDSDDGCTHVIMPIPWSGPSRGTLLSLTLSLLMAEAATTGESRREADGISLSPVHSTHCPYIPYH